MSDSKCVTEIVSVNGSVPTAAESPEQPTNLSSKLYKVWVSAHVQEKRRPRTFSGKVSVYATDEDKAVKTVEAKLKDGKFDDNLEMMDDEDDNVMHMMHYQDVMNDFHLLNQTFDAVELSLDQDEFDLDEAIADEIEDLVESICWNTEALAKHKAFLESLLNEGDDKQAVRRSSVVKDDVDPAAVLEAEVEDLVASISWNTEALAKHNAFLESLTETREVAA